MSKTTTEFRENIERILRVYDYKRDIGVEVGTDRILSAFSELVEECKPTKKNSLHVPNQSIQASSEIYDIAYNSAIDEYEKNLKEAL